MSNYERIFSSVRYMEARLRETVSLTEVADSAGYSSYHFIRLFNGVTGFTPMEYMQKRKLTEAAREIMSTDKRIIDIAFGFDFQNHETFTRAFRKEFGMSPADFRKRKDRSCRGFLQEISAHSMKHRKSLEQQEPEVIDMGRLYFMGLTAAISADYTEIGRMWAILAEEKESMKRRVIPERFFQINYWSDDTPDGTFFCMAAMEALDLDDIPVRFIGKTIQPARYLKFLHRGLSSRVGDTYRFIYEEYLPGTSHRLSLPYNLEFYGPGCRGPMDPESESEIYIPVE
jgi:AraC family transcriptional regulator